MSTPDRLSPLLERFRVRTSLFHTGPLCGTTTFEARGGRGFLHVLRRGDLEVTHADGSGGLTRLRVSEPSLLLYPRPLEHAFHHALVDGSDFTCAALDVEGGRTHPLLRTLPPVVVVPLGAAPNLAPTLDVLFDEVDDVRCGQRLVADRLFEVVMIQLFRWILDHTAELGLPAGLLTGLADPQLCPALVAVHETPEQPWTLMTMAAESAMSRSAFAARFRAVLDQTPGDYLTRWRLTLAQQRLLAGTPVSTVASQLGWNSASAFSRSFSQHLGVAPRDWAGITATSAAPSEDAGVGSPAVS